ncbi:hypothetical protein [Aestuariibacter sp. A3R04]|uniref:hypothetical protein n=1 Tax=Aestuariibacter sp. A3R04 TaxID=2841571 RepID=UPI001C093C5E|nr:hypothetical protein [Aestuariibacter sp. A3R04]MBU3022863.1 hypothetical protein [Aestuariibacter sp. A3R04]
MKNILILSAIVVLSACQPSNNMAGLDRVYLKPVSVDCVGEVVSDQVFVDEFSKDKLVFHFYIDGYKARMLNKTIDGKLSGYAVTIDGMQKGDEPNTFYKKVKARETTIFNAIVERCY